MMLTLQKDNPPISSRSMGDLAMNEQWLVDSERYKRALREWQSSSGNEAFATYLMLAGALLFVGGSLFDVGIEDGQSPVVVATIGAMVGMGSSVWRYTLKGTSHRIWTDMETIRKRFASRGYSIQDNGDLSPL
ncbi:hypothetical protein [Phyllobacterium chamaecytisi]|uniref:hypothetical protein n=1 Tax=Phyllobacterium chamaecytisi TaxID=2876082 RepID=UPI001CCFAB88|nr:hypothetical protein [Phyllobacterium sp. KW56]MBZ9605901.1 hypothetical protein [Phyllobacterium sp. KW56]